MGERAVGVDQGTVRPDHREGAQREDGLIYANVGTRLRV